MPPLNHEQQDDADILIAPSTEPLTDAALQKWLDVTPTQNAVTRQLVTTYLPWLGAVFGSHITIQGGARGKLYVSLDKRLLQHIRMNAKKNAEIWFTDLSPEQEERLRSGIRQPETLKQKLSEQSYPNNWRFNLATKQEIELIKGIMLEIAQESGPHGAARPRAGGLSRRLS